MCRVDRIGFGQQGCNPSGQAGIRSRFREERSLFLSPIEVKEKPSHLD
jgi:hypothetical protein